MTRRLGIILPAFFGIISAPLMIWDVHNQGVITRMGMAWDTGAPLWPYQAPDILLRFLNFPAYVVVQPAVNLLHWYGAQSYLLVFPATVIWWWFVGLRLDCGLVRLSNRRRWSLVAVFVTLEPLLLWVGFRSSVDTFHWWFRYGGVLPWLPISKTLVTLRLLAPTVWSVTLAVLVAVSAKRAITQELVESP